MRSHIWGLIIWGLIIWNPIDDIVYPVPCDAVKAGVAPTAVDILISVLATDVYDVKGVVGDNIKTSDGANVISIVISPYKLVSMIAVDALGPSTLTKF